MLWKAGYYSPRGNDRQRLFKNSIVSKLIKSNHHSSAVTPLGTPRDQNNRARTGRLKIVHDGSSKKKNNSNFENDFTIPEHRSQMDPHKVCSLSKEQSEKPSTQKLRNVTPGKSVSPQPQNCSPVQSHSFISTNSRQEQLKKQLAQTVNIMKVKSSYVPSSISSTISFSMASNPGVKIMHTFHQNENSLKSSKRNMLEDEIYLIKQPLNGRKLSQAMTRSKMSLLSKRNSLSNLTHSHGSKGNYFVNINEYGGISNNSQTATSSKADTSRNNMISPQKSANKIPSADKHQSMTKYLEQHQKERTSLGVNGSDKWMPIKKNHSNKMSQERDNHLAFNFESSNQDSLYFQKSNLSGHLTNKRIEQMNVQQLQDINKNENLNKRQKISMQDMVVRYSSKKGNTFSKRYVIDDTDMFLVNSNNLIKMNLPMAKKSKHESAERNSTLKSSKHNLKSYVDQGFEQIAIKDLSNFPAKKRGDSLTTRRRQSTSKGSREKFVGDSLCAKSLNNIHYQKSKAKESGDSFSNFIVRHTENFKLSLAKRINSKLQYLQERIQRQSEEDMRLKQALQDCSKIEDETFIHSKLEEETFADYSNIYQAGNHLNCLSSFNSDSDSSI